MKPRVAILYLCYGNLRHLSEVVSGLAAQTYPKDRMTVLMLPAGSPDGIANEIRRSVLPRSEHDLPQVILIDEPNRGFAANNNVGIRWALERDYDYVYLHNGDLRLDAKAIEEAVALAEQDQHIGSVQSFVRYWHQPDMVNVTGGMVHVAGYGYARDNGAPFVPGMRANGDEIAYASGAAVLYRMSALRKVGVLEEGFFMYHEDLELGMRLRYAGFTNALAAHSFGFHDYSFSRNPKKFAWMECYRYVVMFGYYRLRTLALLAPLLLAVEAGTWLMAIRGGWFKAKCWATFQWFLPKTWRLVADIRRRAQRLRVISDAAFFEHVTGMIQGQETANPFMERMVNPAIEAAWLSAKPLIRW